MKCKQKEKKRKREIMKGGGGGGGGGEKCVDKQINTERKKEGELRR